MLVVGLTGGIGAGKTTFAALLAEHGAQVIDADQLGRDALRPGTDAWHSVVSQFGQDVLAAETMEIDRKVLAEIVFTDPNRLAALNAIVHPVILDRVGEELDRLRTTDAVVVLDAALIVDTGLRDVCDVLIVVRAGEDERKKRLTGSRDMTSADIAARMRSQSPPGDLAATADIVVDNEGSLADLKSEAERVWSELKGRSG
jgi:dephospho-CoA kinase